MSILDGAKNGMNPGTRPQDDLFGHVNGTWLDTAEIPSDRSSWGPFAELAERSEQQVREIIQELASEPTPRSENARKISALYSSFMDEAAVEARGLDPVRSELEAVAGLGDVRELASFLGGFERAGGSGLFGAYVNTDDRDSDRYLVNLVQGGLGMPDESYYREEKFAEVRERYAAYLTELFTLAESPEPAERAAAVLALETRLAAGHWDRVATRDVQKTYNLTGWDGLTTLAPGFDWSGYVAALGGEAGSAGTLAEALVRQPSYFEHLSGLLGEVPIEQWRSWAMARVLSSAAPFLSAAFVRAHFEFHERTLAGTPELRPRWKRAVSFVERAIGEAVGEEYVARHFPPASKAMMDELVAHLLTAYRDSIAALDWMTEETKQQAFLKLDAFRPKIGYPVRFRDYSALDADAGDLLGNARTAAAFDVDRELAKIGAPVDRDEWFMLPQTVNAYYNPGTNEICFPAGILQEPFFSPGAEPAENYGGIGAVIGHEIGHGFDDQGAQYDGAGNLNDWWTAEDKSAFEKKSKALIDQYDAYSPRDLPGQHVNGALTVGENIGDLGGLTIGHKAYRISRGLDANGTDGLDPAESRTLLLNWAYCWRFKCRKEQAEQRLAIDPHAPAEFRANIVRNLDEFHRAFATAEGDGLWLAEEERVRIW
ncbi:putative endopeptidase [Streptacidiphilus sp. MAP12-33]|uniref:M13 family metallopeptidase n=1 Tax=Streptacidiphilus sp. MAP12-33 TaxID=3156266 RepID=UPI0035138FE9